MVASVRPHSGRVRGLLLSSTTRPLRFAGTGGTAGIVQVVNLLIFSLTRSFLSAPEASLAGIAVAALGNYLMGDRVIFRNRRDART